MSATTHGNAVDGSPDGGNPAGGDTDLVVGFDGSAYAAVAVTWAAKEAARRSSPLRVLSAQQYYRDGAAGAATPEDQEPQAGGVAQRIAEQGARLAGDVLAESLITAHTSADTPAGALVAASTTAGLIVVGHRGRNAVASALLGSVSLAVATHAQCPVVIVRGHAGVEPGPHIPIAVGVDGSTAADLALRFAADMASRCGAPLQIISAWELPPSTGFEYSYSPASTDVEWFREYELIAHSTADAAAATVADSHPELKVSTTASAGSPVIALEQASSHAGLVVVGARGRGGFERLLLGSVSRAIVHHSACPVAVIRA